MTAGNDTSERMRQPAEWMRPSDERILELLREYGQLTPSAVDNLGGPSQNTALNRLPKLRKYGLVEKFAETRGLYAITDAGRSYLDEELDAEELEPVEDGGG